MTKTGSIVTALFFISACQAAPEFADSIETATQAVDGRKLCHEICGPSVPCSTPCAQIVDPFSPPVESSCGFATNMCSDTTTFQEPSNPSTSMPQATGSGPTVCGQARPWEVTFFQHENYNAGWPLVPSQAALCRTFTVQQNGCAPADWNEPWIESGGVGPDGFGFYNDALSSVSIGQNVVLTLYEHANFGGRTLLGRGTTGMGAVNMNLGSVQDMASSFTVTTNRPTRPLQLFWSASREDNYSAGSAEGRANAAAAGYGDAGPIGHIETDKYGGAIALRCYYNAGLGDNLITTSSSPPAGYAPCALRTGPDSNVEGYIWGCGGSNETEDLNLWYNAQRGDYHTVTPTIQSDAVLISQGYVKQMQLGKVLRAARF